MKWFFYGFVRCRISIVDIDVGIIDVIIDIGINTAEVKKNSLHIRDRIRMKNKSSLLLDVFNAWMCVHERMQSTSSQTNFYQYSIYFTRTTCIFQ